MTTCRTLLAGFMLLLSLPPTPYAAAGTLATFKTPVGDLEFELYDGDKPLTVANFIRYIKSGRYGDTFIERWHPGFVVQGGGQYLADRMTAPVVTPVPSFGAITNEYSVGRTLSNVYGTIAMARVGGQTNSATSSWFINLTNNSILDSVDGGFTVFGHIVRGTNVLNKFLSKEAAGAAGIRWIEPNPFHVNLLPVNTTNSAATVENLVFANIDLLRAETEILSNGTRRITWNSSGGIPNRVKYTSELGNTNWLVLLETNGTGGIMQADDTDQSPAQRFYRIALEFE